MAYFTREEALERIKDVLESGYSGYYCDLHDETFNKGYYVIGTNEAKAALNEYDVFRAIGRVYSYEIEQFGETYTDLSDPEKLANMLWYIIGDEVIQGLDSIPAFMNSWNEGASADMNAVIVKGIDKILKN